MDRDIRESGLYREVEALYEQLRCPGTGQISDASELHVAPDGRSALFTGAMTERLEGPAASRICRVDLESGDVRVMSFGPHTDRLARHSPDGRHIAFLSDRYKQGEAQLYLLDPASGAAHATPPVPGWVEYFHWSPDSARILIAVAGHGADVAGGQGAITSKRLSEKVPSWMPSVETGDESYRWRRAYVYELATHSLRQVSPEGCNVWEAVWCGTEAIAAVASSGPGEGLWYSASLQVLRVCNGATREVYVPKDQLGWPAASPSGKHLAVVEALCSDRGIVAGDLRLIDMADGAVQSVSTNDVDVTCLEWQSDRHLLVGGHRGLQSVVCLYDLQARTCEELWASAEISSGGMFLAIAGLRQPGDFALIGEGFLRAPEIAVVRGGRYRSVHSFDLGYAARAQGTIRIEPRTWSASDGLEIQGWLMRPDKTGSLPLVMSIHGGPVWHWRSRWLGRGGFVLTLLEHGYAVFYPNPRGSSGRGQRFARAVLGDMGGKDAGDLLAGLDVLVEERIADRNRLGVIGGSYGGFLTSWLISQDSRFAAAVPTAPVTNQVTSHLVSNIPHFVRLFMADSYTNLGGQYYQRSPILHAHKVRTPTLNVCGALDRCTPPEEAVQFHNALLENGVRSVLLTYPEEGHGIRKLPAAIDYAARVVGWFEEHMPAARESAP